MNKFAAWLESRKDVSDEGAGIFFTDGKCVLLLKRNDPKSFGTWGLPGGHLKDGESPLEGAKREANEECGHFEGEQFSHKEREHENGFLFNTFFFKVEKPFKCTLNSEHSDYAWVNFNKLDGFKLFQPLAEEIDHYIKLTKS